MRIFKNIYNAIFLGAIAFALFGCTPDRHRMLDMQEEEAPQEEDMEVTENILGVNLTEKCEIDYCRFKYLNNHKATFMGERFTQEEYTHGYLTIRTQPQNKEGMYCFAMLSGPDYIGMGCVFELTVDPSNSPKTRVYKFVVSETHSALREVKLGITGSDWPDASAKINAWKLVIRDASGKILAEKQSWLWSMKDSKNNAKDNK